MDLKAGCCQTCKAPCAGDFKKVLDLQYSGLVIYLHKSKDEKNTATSEMDFILHNTRSNQLHHPDYISEAYKFKPLCGQCNSIVETVRGLLDEIRFIKEKEVIGLCEHCIRKQANFNKTTCKRCNFIVQKFIEMHQKQCQDKRERFKVWLCRVRHLLQAILDSQTTCRHRVYRDPELERILRSLREPCVKRLPDIDLYPTRDPDKTICLKRLSENKDMLDELLTRMKFEGEKDLTSEGSHYPCSSEETCMCKALKERLLEGKYLGFAEEPSDLSSLLSQDMYKELIQKLLDLSEALYKGFPINRNLKLELIATLNSAINQSLAPDITKKLVNQLNDLTAIMTDSFTKNNDFDVQAIQDLIKDLNNLIFSRFTKTINNDLVELLIDLTKILGAELSKPFLEEKMEKNTDKVDKDVSQKFTKYLPTKDLPTKDLPTRDLATIELSKISKDETQGSSKFQEKEVKRQDRGKVSSKGLTQPKSTDTTLKLPKDGSIRESPKSQRKYEKQAQKAEKTTQSKDSAINKQLAQKMDDLNKALKKGKLRNEQIQQISNDIKKTLPQKSLDLNKKIIEEVTDLCDPATQGIPSDANLKLVQGLLKDAKKAVTQGLSNNQNKKEVQGRLHNLNKALGTKKDKVKLPADIKKDTSKIIGSSSKPESKDVSKKGLKDSTAASKGTTNFEKDLLLDRKTLKSGKDTTKGKQSFASKDLLKNQENKGITKLGKTPPKDKYGPKSKTDSTKDKRSRRERSEEGFSVTMDSIRKKMIDSSKDIRKLILDASKPKTDTKPKSKNELKRPKMDPSLKEMKGKENLSPKRNETQNKEQDKLKQPDSLEKKKVVSDALLLGMLKSGKHTDPGKLFRERQLAKEKEKEAMERMRLLALQKKNKYKSKKKGLTTISKESSSIIECNIGKEIPNEMIEGECIKPFEPHYKDEILQPIRQPMYYHTNVEFTESLIFDSIPSKRRIHEKNQTKPRQSMEVADIIQSGVTKYQLSNKEFIDRGWTLLPTAKMMRRMNIYKMQPANPQYDWFERHKNTKILTYECGEILAEINDNGRGRWFYRNGQVALEYYDAEELHVGQRYIVYSSDEDVENGKLKPRTILALFDFLGNGVVYDHSGTVRLKYNQSEGLIVDPKLGPPGRWKWHTLNDPPDLQKVFVNVCLNQRDPRLEEAASKMETGDPHYNMQKAPNSAMLAIELDNFAKEKATKLLQKFKPFQIRMKAVKLNENFALKIMDQANIYLLFRDGITNLKLNLGMNLISDEIIDTVTTDMPDVSTPYDQFPAKSESVVNIQKFLKRTRSGKMRRPNDVIIT